MHIYMHIYMYMYMCMYSVRTMITHPLIVEAMKMRYGPIRFLTRGRGMAAASSMQSSSACSSLWASEGCRY